MTEDEAELVALLPEYGSIAISAGEYGEARYARLLSAASELHARGLVGVKYGEAGFRVALKDEGRRQLRGAGEA
ncbi:hypothetical protein [Nannocystis pusilla]|uniref:hypothetical protein n=1 Tax=Nannocystis pusilla TaxID=889268 RepID=UPI003BF3A97C